MILDPKVILGSAQTRGRLRLVIVSEHGSRLPQPILQLRLYRGGEYRVDIAAEGIVMRARRLIVPRGARGGRWKPAALNVIGLRDFGSRRSCRRRRRHADVVSRLRHSLRPPC